MFLWQGCFDSIWDKIFDNPLMLGIVLSVAFIVQVSESLPRVREYMNNRQGVEQKIYFFLSVLKILTYYYIYRINFNFLNENLFYSFHFQNHVRQLLNQYILNNWYTVVYVWDYKGFSVLCRLCSFCKCNVFTIQCRLHKLRHLHSWIIKFYVGFCTKDMVFLYTLRESSKCGDL